MFERFTDRARRVLVLAQEEARLLQHSYVGTEHLLLGLIHEGEGLASKALESLGISLEAAREKVEETIGPVGSAPTGVPPFTPRSKKVLELSLREALQLGHNYIGTEHILLGIVREGQGVAAQVLFSLGADMSRVRQQVIQLLSGYQGEERVASRGVAQGPARRNDDVLFRRDLEQLVAHWIGKLIEYDLQHHSQMLETLTAYLKESGSVAATAAALQVHRKTLKYRLARIAELTGWDLEDPEQRFHLDLACRAWQALQSPRRVPLLQIRHRARP
jgi:ATP-dependent Clp protease ATP-binding subunit ClpA